MKRLVLLFILKLYARVNIFKYNFVNFLNKYTWVPWQIRKTRLLDLSSTQFGYGLRSSVPSLSTQPSCYASNHGTLKHVACFTCSLFL